jgi:hypothetical protein
VRELKAGDLICCESTAAVVIHLRRLSAAGPKYSGGIDTAFLCSDSQLHALIRVAVGQSGGGFGNGGGWDLKVDVDVFAKRPAEPGLCRKCRDRYTGFERVVER